MDNPSAFPFQPVTVDGEPNSPEYGMSLRDWFAGQALAGLTVELSDSMVTDLSEGIRGGRFVAGAAYQIADAMLAERAKGGAG
jgi:hypothetical protein